jgi:hypothetical protein
VTKKYLLELILALTQLQQQVLIFAVVCQGIKVVGSVLFSAYH